MEKDSPSFFGGWSLRYVILKGQRFVYKEDASPASQNAGILNFDLLSCEIAVEMNRNVINLFRILIKNVNKEFVFRGRSPKETEMWFNAITKAAYRAQSQHKSMDYMAKYPRFWRVSLFSHRRIA